jgi:AcrR family transcriptional regulator
MCTRSGYHQAGVQEIAAVAGVAKPTALAAQPE